MHDYSTIIKIARNVNISSHQFDSMLGLFKDTVNKLM